MSLARRRRELERALEVKSLKSSGWVVRYLGGREPLVEPAAQQLDERVEQAEPLVEKEAPRREREPARVERARLTVLRETMYTTHSFIHRLPTVNLALSTRGLLDVWRMIE